MYITCRIQSYIILLFPLFFIFLLFLSKMPVELNALSYILLTTIFSAASAIAIKNGRHSDAHPLVLNSQGGFSQLRYAGESATIKSRLYSNGAPSLCSNDTSINTLSDLYQVAFSKYKEKFLVSRSSHEIIWVCVLFFCNGT